MKINDLVARVQQLVNQRNDWSYSDQAALDRINDVWARVFSNSRLTPDQQEAVVILAAYRLITDDGAVDRLRQITR